MRLGLLYGSGLRRSECARMRVKDLGFDEGEVVVRETKSHRDRVTLFPDTLKLPPFPSSSNCLPGKRLRHEGDDEEEP